MMKLSWGWSARYSNFHSYKTAPGRGTFHVRYGNSVYPSFWRLFLDRVINRPRYAWHAHLAEKHAALGGCENCGSFWRLRWWGSMTAYHWTGEGENPNRDRWFCEPCGQDYTDAWQAQWDEYNYSRG